MKILKDINLAPYSAMRLGGNARYFCTVTSEKELEEAVLFAEEHKLTVHTVGEGSNTVFTDGGFEGLVIHNQIMGVQETSNGDSFELKVGSGENWDALVARSVASGCGDIAALSLVPGTAGAAPVQNIGAYGQQVSDSIVSVRAYDLSKREFVTILRKDCNFSYRHSRFNLEDSGKYIITQITLQLSRKKMEAPFYADVEHYFKVHGIKLKSVTPQNLRDAVIAVRTKKLPDPRKVANCGSFFGNPVVSEAQYKKLLQDHPQLKAHNTDDGKLKLYAGQLIELAGLQNYHDKATGMSTWKNQSLVLVNESANSTADLLSFKNKIVTNVKAVFGVTLVQEPELVGE